MLWRQLRHGLRALTRRAQLDRDIADEVEHYLEQATAAHMADGLTREQAVRAARLELGSEVAVREQVRSYGWENVLEALLVDARYAWRRLRTEPGFTSMTILTLALGLGGTTAVFSVVNPVLFETLPYPAANRIAMVTEQSDDGTRSDGTFGMYRQLADHAKFFSSIAVFKPWQPTNTGGERAERFEGQRVSASYFQVLGVQPALGRLFQPSDDRLNGPNVAVLNDALWRRRFNGDGSIIGRQITLDDIPYTVIGVLRPEFENVLSPTAEVWAPLQYDMSQGRAWGHHLRTVARLADGANLSGATQELNALGNALLGALDPPTYGAEVRLLATTLQHEVTRAVRPALVAILGAVLLVLAVACVNVTNLLLARAAQRQGEFALRAALGAGYTRLIRQLLTESLLLAVLGGAFGILVALLGVRALVALSPPELPRLSAVAVDGRAFLFALAVTSVIGLVCGALPAVQAARSDPQRALQRAARRTVAGRARTRNVLVVTEVAFALVLLVSSGLLLRSLQRLFAIDSGFDASQMLTLQIQVSPERYSEQASANQFFTQVLERVRQVPGVSSAALTSQLPLSGDFDRYGVQFDPSLRADPGEEKGTFRYAVSPGYLETMGIPLRKGRLLNQRDVADAPLVALVSEALVRRRLPGLDPIGQRVRIGSGPLYTVVGVVGDVKQQSLALSESEAVYVTEEQWRFADNVMWLVVRARGDATALTDAVRAAVWTVDRDQPVVRIGTMESLLAASAAERRFALILFEVFALATLALAAAGIYGVISGSVTERVREIGVRCALGATRAGILALVLRQGMTLAGMGVLIGVLGAAAASQLLVSMLFGTSPLDAPTYLAVTVLLTLVSLLACALPAWRAARVDPALTLRE